MKEREKSRQDNEHYSNKGGHLLRGIAGMRNKWLEKHFPEVHSRGLLFSSNISLASDRWRERRCMPRYGTNEGKR